MTAEQKQEEAARTLRLLLNAGANSLSANPHQFLIRDITRDKEGRHEFGVTLNGYDYTISVRFEDPR